MKKFDYRIEVSEKADEDGFYKWIVFNKYRFVEQGYEFAPEWAMATACESVRLDMTNA
jgi:hypothetical protein